MKILVVEDEKKTAAYLKKGLEENGFVVDVAPNGLRGLENSLHQTYDLLILDVMLPEVDGWEMLAQLRQEQVETPVLFLSALGSVRDRVKGLELGADDYLVKPFAFSELLARVRILLRRRIKHSSLPKNHAAPRMADLEIDHSSRKAMRGGTTLDLTPKEFQLLEFLIRHTGEVVSRTLIAEQVWDMNFDGHTNVVDVHIRRLRSKVDDPFNEKLIHTIRGSGYVLEARN